MAQTVEKKRPPVKWLVPIPANEGGSFGRPSLCAACRGNDVMAVILNYFVYEASTEAEQKKIDTLKVQSIQLERTHDEIIKGLQPSRISKKTLIDYMRKLEAWGFLKVDGYHHIYEVFFSAITEAMKTPPPAEKRKPRGRHVSQKVKSTNLQSTEVKGTILGVKSSNSEDCTLEQISNLQSEMLNLQSQMSKLQFEMLNLTFAQSSKAAPQLVLTPLFERSRLIDCNRLIEIDSLVAANADNDTPSPLSFPVFHVEMTSDDAFRDMVGDWMESHPPVRLAPTVDAMANTLKRLRDASLPGRDDSAASGGLSAQPANTMTSQVPPSNDAVGTSTSVAFQANNDRGEDDTPSVAPLTAFTGDTPLQVSRIASETQQPNGEKRENATVGDGVATEQSAKPKKPRTPAEKKDEPTKDQIDAVYTVFDELFRETLETPDPDFSCMHTKTSTEAIKELVKRKATPARLRGVFKDMWDEERDGVYWWRSHGHMTIKAVCNNYGARVLSLEGARGKAPAKDKPADAKSIMEALTATSSYQPLQFAPRPERKAQ